MKSLKLPLLALALFMSSLSAYALPLSLCKSVFGPAFNQPLNSLTLSQFTKQLGAGTPLTQGFQYTWVKNGYTLTVMRKSDESGVTLMPTGPAPAAFQRVFDMESSKPDIAQIEQIVGLPATTQNITTYGWSCDDDSGGTYHFSVTADGSGKIIGLFSGAQ